ncbi:hypothetical protein [Amycolatopsis sp. WQ 127309]|uniref:hypothetical protein n=1 Tax=Amycolatopsis sp. WQ 127309 TaxID=2932773 RepID=UPI001FF12AB0|nr:hypothetical protein [Amycolatopsis sp. WQ 127309]UOZ06316.1 hypothetical protein MUY22_47235 [Amycolatopsis sp. WQ 127309]
MTGTKLRRRATVVTALGALALIAPPAQAAGTTVPCDAAALVQAVAAATATTDADTLSLAPGCDYALTAVADTTWAAGLPSVRGKLTVQGNHATIRRATGAPQFRLIANWGDLTLTDVTLTGGHAPDGVGAGSDGRGNPGESGGAIENWGPLSITGSTVTGNTSGSGGRGADGGSPGRGGPAGFGGGISSYIGSTTAPLTIAGSEITGNTTGDGGRGGDATGTATGGDGGSGGFGGGLYTSVGTVLRITGSTVTGNTAGVGGPGGTGGPGTGSGAGGSGGSGGGLFVSTRQGEHLNPVVTATEVSGNHAGRGGDAGVPGAGGYVGWAGYGGNGGGLGLFYDALTFDGGSVTGNTAGEPGAGYSPLAADAGGVYTLDARVTLADGATVTGNRPRNCSSVADVPGCVNDGNPLPYAAVAGSRDGRAAAAVAAFSASARR